MRADLMVDNLRLEGAYCRRRLDIRACVWLFNLRGARDMPWEFFMAILCLVWQLFVSFLHFLDFFHHV